MIFDAHPLPGAARGRTIGTPTINLALADIPPETRHGIYAGRIRLGPDGAWLPAAIHFGPRPAFDDDTSFEVHVLDRKIASVPAIVTVELVRYLREVRGFPTIDALKEQIADDIEKTRAILGDDVPGPTEAADR